MGIRKTFPFTAIVGQEKMKRALILNAVYPAIGGVLIRGERGTAKSTAARSMAELLPDIQVVDGCPFRCNPADQLTMCPQCRTKRNEEIIATKSKVAFVELPIGATEDRVVGTLDIEKAMQKGEKRFEPGVLAKANRGLLYVDEVNLLDDYIVDVLLDSAAMGVCTVEREGISFTYPSRFLLIGTMNPEEGDLRPQLLDRFALCINIESIREKDDRVEILKRNISYERDPEQFYKTWAEKERKLAERICSAQAMLGEVKYSEAVINSIAATTNSLKIDGHRADMVILRTSIANAAFEGRKRVSVEDIMLATELALPHRLKRNPLGELTIQPEEMDKLMTRLKAMMSQDQDFSDDECEELVTEAKKKPNLKI